MSTLKELLKDVPVEWKALVDLVEILDSKRKPVSKSQRINGIYPYYGANGIQDYINDYIFDGTYLLIGEDGSVINEDGSPVINWATGKIWVNNHAHILAEKTNSSLRYLYYYLSTIDVRKIVKGSIPKITQQDLRKIQIPIPYPNDPQKSLEIQQEIVRVLDGLSEQNKALTAALDQEVEQRKKQYEHYREELFRFEGKEVEWKTLGEVISKSYSGSTPRAGNVKYYQNGSIPWLRTQEVKFSEIAETEIKITETALKETGVKWIPANCVIIAISGATAGRSAINKIPLTTNQHCLCLDINSDIAYYKYIFYWVSKNYEHLKSLGRGARGDLNTTIIKNLAVPVPSIQEQECIVRLLDQFDEATKNILAQLEKEIELRNKQYEYYRNLLLSFPKGNN